MFKKLLKYDMLSVWRLWWIGAIIVPIAAVVGGLMPHVMEAITAREEEFGFYDGISFMAARLLMIVCILAIAFSVVFTMVLVFVRFYKNLFTDEGYLTFTLPVKRKQILRAKTLNALIWYVLHILLIVGAYAIFFFLSSSTDFNSLGIIFTVDGEFGMLFRNLWDEIGAWTVLFGAEFVVWILISLLCGISMVHLCITIGAVLVKRAKIVVAIGLYYVFQSVSTFLGQIFLLFGIAAVGVGLDSLMSSMTNNQVCSIIALMLLIVLCIMSAITAVIYNLTQRLIDRKLNLA